MYIAVRLRGHAGVNSDIEETMGLLGLNAPNTCIIIVENAVNKGMLQKAKDYVAWGEADESILKSGIFAKKVDPKGLANVTAKYSGERIVVRFSPPSKGFKSLKLHHPKGDLGYHGKEIAEFIKIYE